MSFQTYAAESREAVEAILARYLPPADTFPPRLHQAMRYTIEAGGKRLRPILALAVGELLGSERRALEPMAAAIELIHNCSLILDDLPCMDDGLERHGKPALHHAYDESTALLAAEGLLMLAFEVLGESIALSSLKARESGEVLRLFGSTLGSSGMIGGQQVDLQMVRSRLDVKVMEYRHSRKTGSLFHLAVKGPALIGHASAETITALEVYAKNLGLAYQIADDLRENEPASVPAERKAARRKAPTFVDLCGRDEAEQLHRQLVSTAQQSLTSFGPAAHRLADFARFVGDRVP